MNFALSKRIFDYVLALVLILPVGVVLLLISPFSLIHFNGKVFYKQLRIGRNQKSFFIYKLRSMYDVYDVKGCLLADHLRTPPWGSFLRRSSLDELPQLINILKGELSFIGPRPLPICYLDYLSQQEKRRHSILPGITGLAQVKGGNRIDWDEKFRLDAIYLQHQSFWMDITIFIFTIVLLISFKKNEQMTDLLSSRATGLKK